MTAKYLFVCAAGFAISNTAAQEQPQLKSLNASGEVYHAVRATAITALTVDGDYVYGRTIEFNPDPAALGTTSGAYDSTLMADTNNDRRYLEPVCANIAPHTFAGIGSRYFFGTEFSAQSFSEDIVPASGTEGAIIKEIAFMGVRPLCDHGTGATSEVMQQIFESWEVIDNFPNLDGTDGYDPDGDGLVFPFDRNDTDGDTFVDEFNGGIILTYANKDTDGDTVNDQFHSTGAAGYGIFTANTLGSLCIPLPSGVDRHDGSGGGPDGRPDGGIRFIWTRGDGGDMNGPLTGGFYPATRASSMFWGTTAMEVAGTTCPFNITNTPGFGAGYSDGIIWGEGEDLCNDPNNAGGAWSQGAPSGNEAVDDNHDPLIDVGDWFGIVPDFVNLGPTIRLGIGELVDCCDANRDTFCTPTDFTAWINAYTLQLSECDVNQDCFCTPTDFVEWVNAYSLSTAAPSTPIYCRY